MESTITKTATIKKERDFYYSVYDQYSKTIGTILKKNNSPEWIVRIYYIRNKLHCSDVKLAIALAKEILINQGYKVEE